MNDRELLELAAKAAGLEIESWGEMNGNAYGWHVVSEHVSQAWWPLADDGDALRLAVRLNLMLDTAYNGCIAVGSATLCEILEPHDGDPCAATRRAIVLAAAEIGRRMP